MRNQLSYRNSFSLLFILITAFFSSHAITAEVDRPPGWCTYNGSHFYVGDIDGDLVSESLV